MEINKKLIKDDVKFYITNFVIAVIFALILYHIWLVFDIFILQKYGIKIGFFSIVVVWLFCFVWYGLYKRYVK